MYWHLYLSWKCFCIIWNKMWHLIWVSPVGFAEKTYCISSVNRLSVWYCITPKWFTFVCSAFWDRPMWKTLWGLEVENIFGCWSQHNRWVPYSFARGQRFVISEKSFALIFIFSMWWWIKSKECMFLNDALFTCFIEPVLRHESLGLYHVFQTLE